MSSRRSRSARLTGGYISRGHGDLWIDVQKECGACTAMVSLRKRLDNIVIELAVLSEALKESSLYPPCCIEIQNDGKISCDVTGPLPEKEFLKECKKCRAHIKEMMSQINLCK